MMHRRYWTAARERAPDLHFELIEVYQGIDAVVIHYSNQRGAQVNEVLLLRGGLVVSGYGTYAAPAG